MSEKNRYINTKFWNDNYISNLDPIEKLLFLYLLTNPCTNLSGIYEIQLKHIAVDTGIDKEMIEKIFQRFEKDNKVVYRNGWIAITNFIKHQKMNPNVKRGIEENLKKAPESIMVEYDRLSEAYSYLNLNSNLNYNPNLNLNLTRLNQFYNPQNDEVKYPTLEEFEKYCKDNDFEDINIKACWHHYNANGWRQANGLKIVRWHSVPSTWRNNSKRFEKDKKVIRDIKEIRTAK
jgi:hypothetical protein